MDIITVFDNWMFDKTVIALDYLSEWFSISQGQVERFLIIAFGLSCVAEMIGRTAQQFGLPLWLVGFLLAGMVFFMYLKYRATSSERSTYRVTDLPYRIIWMILMVLFLLPPYRNKFYNFGVVCEQISLVSFMYTIASNSNGERGRKRKMAWAKLKEMFSWLPAPQPEGA